MRYLLLNYTNEAYSESLSPEQQAAMIAAYNEFAAMAREHIIGGEVLRPSTSASTVRLRDGETLISDGPFAETKEQLAGYYVVNCANLDEAIAIAAKIPAAQSGAIEVRPIMEWD
ncbi:MAG: YciI family protein [Ktedonobacterales bacterium]|nr:YciI family protein [Ktedonobacterales bacterium]